MAQKKKSVYAGIADDILSKIQSGIYAVGTLLPPEREFMTIYGVERTTVRRGLDILKKSGYIRKIAGLGSMVASLDGQIVSDGESCKNEASSVSPVAKGTEKNVFGLFSPEQGLSLFIDAYLTALRKKAGFTKGNSGSAVLAVESDAEGVEDSKLCFGLSSSDDARSVTLDSDHAVRLALSYLTQSGHSSFAFIGNDSRFDYEWSLYNSYISNLTLSSLSHNTEYINLSSVSERSAFEAFGELIRRHSGKFSAVIVAGDEAASGVLKAAKHYRLSVPGDISVINLCSCSKNPVTDCIYFDADGLADETVVSLSKTEIPSTILFKGRLISNGTVARKDVKGISEGPMSDFLL